MSATIVIDQPGTLVVTAPGVWTFVPATPLTSAKIGGVAWHVVHEVVHHGDPWRDGTRFTDGTGWV